MNQNGLLVSQYGCLRDNALTNRLIRRNGIHDIHHDAFHDGTEASGSCLSFYGHIGNGFNGIVLKEQLHIVEVEQLPVLLDQSVPGLLQNSYQRVPVETLQGNNNRNTSDKLRDQSELHQVLRNHFL